MSKHAERDPAKHIVELFGKDIGPKQRLIEGVVLADGTKLLAEQVQPWQWEAAGLNVNGRPALNRAERRKQQRRH